MNLKHFTKIQFEDKIGFCFYDSIFKKWVLITENEKKYVTNRSNCINLFKKMV